MSHELQFLLRLSIAFHWVGDQRDVANEGDEGNEGGEGGEAEEAMCTTEGNERG